MMKNAICPVSGQTFEEERLNHLTHFVGLVFSVIGFPVLIFCSFVYGDMWHVMSFSVYGLSLILLYAASTYYHRCESIPLKGRLKVFDHACIFLLIAGSYTPFALGPLRDSSGWVILLVEWSIAVIGILFKCCAFDRFQVVSLIAYLVMGWMIVFSWSALIENMNLTTLLLMASGGISYTLGTLFFIWEKLPYHHGIWHLFVLGGSMCHYFAILSVLF